MPIFDWTIAGSGAPVYAGGAVVLDGPGRPRYRVMDGTPTLIPPSGTQPNFMDKMEGAFNPTDKAIRRPYNHSPTNDNTAATLTFPAKTGKANCIENLVWSYSGTPTAPSGNLKITDGGSTIFNQDITAAGPGFFPFVTPLKGSNNSAMVVTLAPAGASGVLGKVSVNHWLEPGN